MYFNITEFIFSGAITLFGMFCYSKKLYAWYLNMLVDILLSPCSSYARIFPLHQQCFPCLWACCELAVGLEPWAHLSIVSVLPLVSLPGCWKFQQHNLELNNFGMAIIFKPLSLSHKNYVQFQFIGIGIGKILCIPS